jgi:agmatinase
MSPVPVARLATRHVAFLGVPWDAMSSFLRGAAGGPAAVRRALASPSANWTTESGRDLAAEERLVDAGDVHVGADASAVEAIATQARAVLATGARVIACGGDHAVSLPLVQAHAALHGPLTVLHLDAHPDLYDTFEGQRFSHACPFARIMEAGLARRLVQVGIRTMTPHQRAQADRFGVEVMPMDVWPAAPLVLDGPVYLSLDLDVMDPAFVPGVSHHEPGGASVRDVVRLVQRLQGRLVGADVVELNPSRDRDDVTAMVAAKCVRELIDRLLE